MNTIDTGVTEHSVCHAGGSLHVLDHPGEEPAIVMMHGFPDDHRIYDKLVPLLSPRRVVVIDWFGYRRSDRSDRSDAAVVSSETHESELRAVLEDRGIARAVVVGHDASGPDAVAFAVARPERDTHLVLLNIIFGHLSFLTLPEMIRLLRIGIHTARRCDGQRRGAASLASAATPRRPRRAAPNAQTAEIGVQAAGPPRS